MLKTEAFCIPTYCTSQLFIPDAASRIHALFGPRLTWEMLRREREMQRLDRSIETPPRRRNRSAHRYLQQRPEISNFRRKRCCHLAGIFLENRIRERVRNYSGPFLHFFAVPLFTTTLPFFFSLSPPLPFFFLYRSPPLSFSFFHFCFFLFFRNRTPKIPLEGLGEHYKFSINLCFWCNFSKYGLIFLI